MSRTSLMDLVSYLFGGDGGSRRNGKVSGMYLTWDNVFE